jgi:succinate dehydrogenase/fumarate reductase flavoprotein subunit
VVWLRNEKDLKEAIKEIAELREEFHKEVFVPGDRKRIQRRTWPKLAV